MYKDGFKDREKTSEEVRIHNLIENTYTFKQRTNYEAKLRQLDNYFIGNHWENLTSPYGDLKITTNYCSYAHAYKSSALMADNLTPEFKTIDPRKQEITKILNDLFSHVWEATNQPFLKKQHVMLSTKNSFSVELTEVDLNKVDGRTLDYKGVVTQKIIEPMRFYWDTGSFKIEDCIYAGYWNNYSLNGLYFKIIQDEGYSKECIKALDTTYMEYKSRYDSMLPKDSTSKLREPFAQDTGGAVNQTRSGQDYTRDYSACDVMYPLYCHYEKKIDSKGKIRVFKSEILNGFVIKKEELKWTNKLPFAVNYDYVIPDSFFGDSVVRQIIGPQRTINTLDSIIVGQGVSLNNRTIMLTKSSGINAKVFQNVNSRPGGVITTKDPNPALSAYEFSPRQVDQVLMQLREAQLAHIKDILGLSQAYTGSGSANSDSAKAVEQLLGQAKKVDGVRLANLEKFIVDSGTLFLEGLIYCLANGSGVRRFKSTAFNEGQDGTGSGIELSYDKKNKKLIIKDMEIKGEDGKPLTKIIDFDTGKYNPKHSIALNISVTQKQSQDPAAQQQILLSLLALQAQSKGALEIYTPQEWVRIFDLPLQDDIIKRIRTKEFEEKQKTQEESKGNINQIIAKYIREVHNSEDTKNNPILAQSKLDDIISGVLGKGKQENML